MYSLLLVLLALLQNVATSLKISMSAKPLYCGFDFGTSGVRCCLTDSNKVIKHEDSLLWNSMPISDAGARNEGWDSALKILLERTPEAFRRDIVRICVSGTSSTALVFDKNTKSVTRRPRMYDFNVVRDESTKTFGEKAMSKIKSVCPNGSATDATSSTLAKLLSWHYETPILPSERLVHQSDWLAQSLVCDFHPTGEFVSDWNNALKLGYEVLCPVPEYPPWLISLLKTEGIDVSTCFPSVIEPGRVIAKISKTLAERLGFSDSCEVVAGKYC
jgi:xylulokinase